MGKIQESALPSLIITTNINIILKFKYGLQMNTQIATIEITVFFQNKNHFNFSIIQRDYHSDIKIIQYLKDENIFLADILIVEHCIK